MSHTPTKLSFDEYIGGIYVIECLYSPKIYIGSTECFEDRFDSHIKSLRGNYHINKKLQHSFNEHGEEAFTFSELERYLFSDKMSKTEKRKILFPLEQSYLDTILHANLDNNYFTKNAYNINRRVEGGGISERVVSVFDLNMNFIEEFPNPISASRKYGKPSGIVGCCNGKLGRAGNNIFRYSDNINIHFEYKKRKSGYVQKNRKPVYQYSLDGEFIKEWRCVQEVYNITSINWANIFKAISGDAKSAGGYMWSYEKHLNIPPINRRSVGFNGK